ncbi:Imm1 family immunity protein [Duganella sp. Root336D2]|uniref:Imm1 family immunity protein n=1 Tax=Duganella sp. Root336D2 TaxID=1736518 RepID=UPI0006FC9A5D|nr:Imm1 family immunity protein [Duganella sp. Root336D2]KQV59515.1 hypothetical protein ASD07_25225 [Duganella sp. Root336D2]
MLKIIDGNGTIFAVGNDAEMDALFESRYENNANEFWISEDGKDFPYLVAMIKDDLGCLQYFSDEDHAGLNSVGDESAQGYSLFYINITEEQDIANDMVIPVSKVLDACKEFMKTKSVPKSVKWVSVTE